jgi:hypothetical protein
VRSSFCSSLLSLSLSSLCVCVCVCVCLMAALADIGLVGLAVMGENLALNILNHGYSVAVCTHISVSLTKRCASDFSFFHLCAFSFSCASD